MNNQLDNEKDLSIVIPVYNAIDVLPTCINSILCQTVDLSRVEVLLVDDGSTDGSAGLCDSYARDYPELFRVIHQENTGGPANPRNQGIRVAQGTYLFFCDNDDRFGSEAFERMLQHAFEWDSDVLVCRCGKTSRDGWYWGLFEGESEPVVDLYTSRLFYLATPWKCFRRTFLLDGGIQFPEDCSLDDMVFSFETYTKAKRVSLACDYDYYYWCFRDEGVNLSNRSIAGSLWHDIDRRLLAAERCLDLLDEHLDPTKDTTDFYVRALGWSTIITLQLIAKEDAQAGSDHLATAQAILVPYCTEDRISRLRFSERVLYRCLMTDCAFACFSATGCVFGRGVQAFQFHQGHYRCSYCVNNGVECTSCDYEVEREVQRIREFRSKHSDDLSDAEIKELAWLAKQEAKVKMEDSVWGRAGLAFARVGFMRRVLRPIKKALFK